MPLRPTTINPPQLGQRSVLWLLGAEQSAAPVFLSPLGCCGRSFGALRRRSLTTGGGPTRETASHGDPTPRFREMNVVEGERNACHALVKRTEKGMSTWPESRSEAGEQVWTCGRGG